MKLNFRNPFKKWKKTIDQKTCAHKSTTTHPPKTALSKNVKVVCNKCGKVFYKPNMKK